MFYHKSDLTVLQLYHLICVFCSNKEIASVFDDFNQGELSSYLIEITHKILLKPDEDIVVWKDSTMLPKVRVPSAREYDVQLYDHNFGSHQLSRR